MQKDPNGGGRRQLVVPLALPHAILCVAAIGGYYVGDRHADPLSRRSGGEPPQQFAQFLRDPIPDT